MNLSDDGALLIANSEGFSSAPYWDPDGRVWTIGYGSTVGVTKSTRPISRPEALARLKREVDATYGAAVDALRLPFNQNQYDALCSFTYNLGPGAIAIKYDIGKALRSRDWRRAADEMLEWNKAGDPPRPMEGLTRRRERERALFLKPVPARAPKHERQMVDRITYHRKGAFTAKAGSAAKKKHAAYREIWKARARAQMVRLQASARAPKQGGWKKDGRGTRYQLLRNAVLGK